MSSPSSARPNIPSAFWLSHRPTNRWTCSSLPPGDGKVAGHRPQLAQLQPGLLDGLAARHLLGLFVRIDQPGDQLDQPGIARLAQRADAELLDQHHPVQALDQ